MERSTETASFTTSILCLAGFSSFMAFLVYLFLKFTATKSEENESASTNGTTAKTTVKDRSNAGSDGKGAKKKKVKGQRERTSSKTEHVPDTDWLQTTLKGHSTEVVGMTFSPNYKYLASVGNDRVVFLWHTKNFSSRDHTHYRVNLGFDLATAVCFSPDSKAFMVSKTDRTVEVYKLGKKTETEGTSRIQLAVKVKTEHSSPIVGIGIHPKFMMTCEERNQICCWSFKGALLERLDRISDGKNNLARLSPCGRFVAICGKFNDNVNLFKFDVAQDFASDNSKILTGKKPIWTSKGGEVYSFDWARDSSKIVALGPQGGELVWKLFDVQGARAAEICGGSIPKPENPNEDPALPVVRLSADGHLLLVGAGEGVFFFSIQMGGLSLGNIPDVHYDSPVLDLAFGEGDKQFLTCGDKSIRIFINVPGKREMLRQMEKTVGEKATGTAMKTRLKAEIIALEEELRPFNKSVQVEQPIV